MDIRIHFCHTEESKDQIFYIYYKIIIIILLVDRTIEVISTLSEYRLLHRASQFSPFPF